jgi:hypothetical protein
MMTQQSTLAPDTEGVEQCRDFLSTLAPKDGSREIWIKQGHESIYRATWDEKGNLSGILTALATAGDTSSRIDKGKVIFNLLKVLSDLCKKHEGGAFYVPTQPQKLPTASCVTCTDDIGVEVDDLGHEAQLELFESFQAVSSLSLSSLLSSGSKSFHAHIKVDFHAPLPEMTYLRRLAQLAFTSDPKMVDLHQPMRLPGFYRKEKQSMQTLINFSDAKYSLEAIKAGFQKWFIFKGWVFPEDISDTWWSEVFRPNLNGLNKATREAKIRFTEKMLAEGQDAYVSRRIAETEQRQQAIAKMPAVTGTQISDLVQACCDRANIGDFSGVDWQGSQSHLRGQCPFHKGETGNSAWLSDAKGALRFHCSSCTGDAPRTSFEYWVARSIPGSSIAGDHGLKGKDYVTAAEVFLGQYGVSIPEQPKKENTNGNGHKPVDAVGLGLLVGSKEVETASGDDGSSCNGFEPLDMPKIPIIPGQVEATGKLVLKKLGEEKDAWQKVYFQGGTNEHQLVRILSTNGKSDIISRLDLDRFQCAVNEKMLFESGKKKENAPCPIGVAKHIFSKDRWPTLQRLNLISRIPVLTKEGKVLDMPGYHEDEAALLDFNPKDFCIKDIPTKDDAIEALLTLKDLFKECCFGSDLDQAAAIGMVLTAFSRNLYDFAPMFATSANAAGAGKGTISAIVSILLTGRSSSGLTQFIPDEVELAKQILSSLLEAPPIVNFDNVKEHITFGGSTIESLLSTEFFKKRVLGASKDAELSTRLLWAVNGNNLKMTTDMIRRSILINLISKIENPQDRVFERKDIFRFTSKNRGKYISAALTILKAFITINPPHIKAPPLNGFVPWDDIVRQSLLWLDQSDIVQSQKALQEEDESKEVLRIFMFAWREKYGNASQALSDVIKAASNNEALYAAISPFSLDKSGKLSSIALSRKIRSYKNAIVSNMQIVRSETMTNGSYNWKVAPLDTESDESEKETHVISEDTHIPD